MRLLHSGNRTDVMSFQLWPRNNRSPPVLSELELSPNSIQGYQAAAALRNENVFPLKVTTQTFGVLFKDARLFVAQGPVKDDVFLQEEKWWDNPIACLTPLA
ncbi:hypothetical protein V6N13_080526 [Hibiscus sabdariffa]